MRSFAPCYVGDLCVPYDEEYIAIVRDIFDSAEFKSMKDYIQHGDTSCLTHSINVSYLSYLYAKEHNLDFCSAARGGLLHDLFLYNWHTYRRSKGERLHGFSHPRKALENAQQIFELNEIEKDIILRHMWPLTLTPPKYKESYVIVCYDKYCSLMETMYLPAFEVTAQPVYVNL